MLSLTGPLLARQRIGERIRELLDRGLERAGSPVRLLPVRGPVVSGAAVGGAGLALGAQGGHAVALPTTGASPTDLATAPWSPHSTNQLASIR